MGEYAMSPASDLLDVSEITAEDLQRARDALSLSPADMVQKANKDKVRRQATLMKMADKVEQACEELGITVDDDTLVAVATTLSVDGGTLFQDGNPLTGEDRRVALEIVYRWAKAKAPTQSEFDLRALAEQTVVFAEAGRAVGDLDPTPRSNLVETPRSVPAERPRKPTTDPKPPQRKPNPCGLIGFGLGIASVFLSFIGIIPLLGIIFSVVGLVTHDDTKHEKAWQAKWGLGLSIVFGLVNMSMYGHF